MKDNLDHFLIYKEEIDEQNYDGKSYQQRTQVGTCDCDNSQQ